MQPRTLAGSRRRVSTTLLNRLACGRIAPFTVVLLFGLIVQLTRLDTSLASFANLLVAGPQALSAATLATPVGLATANGGCAGGNEKTNVSASWTASAELDANGNPLVNGYTVLRSTSSGGSYSSVGSTGIATSFTDVNPSGAATPQVYVGNNGEAVKTVHAINTSTNAGTSIATGAIGIEPIERAAYQRVLFGRRQELLVDFARLVLASGALKEVAVSLNDPE